MILCKQATTTDELSAQNSALWDVWLDKYVKRLTADMADVADVESADRTRRQVMNSTNPRSVGVRLCFTKSGLLLPHLKLLADFQSLLLV